MVRPLKNTLSELCYLELMIAGDVHPCGETFKVQSGTLNCNSEKVLCLLKCKVCGEAPMLEKPKLSFNIGSITIKANIELSEKETEKYPRNFFTIIFV